MAKHLVAYTSKFDFIRDLFEEACIELEYMFIHRITTSEGTFDLKPQPGVRLTPSAYYMRKEQASAFGCPELTEAIREKRWVKIKVKCSDDDFVFCR